MTGLRPRQTLPAEMAERLCELRGSDNDQLNSLLLILRMNGWTEQACADALGISHQAIAKRLTLAKRPAAIDVPLPPRAPTPMPDPPRKMRLRVPPHICEELRAQHAIARTVNGTTPADDPRREISVAFTATLASLHAQGVSQYQLAQILGVHHHAVFSRLARHGYRKLAPSQAHQGYRGYASYENPKNIGSVAAS